MTRSLALALIIAAALPAGCARTGTGAGVRADITARMASAQGPIQQCYADALQRNRKLRGMMVVNFRAAPDSGKFENLNVTRDETADAPLRQCVIEQMSTLKLATPQRTGVDISYPIRFQPSN